MSIMVDIFVSMSFFQMLCRVLIIISICFSICRVVYSAYCVSLNRLWNNNKKTSIIYKFEWQIVSDNCVFKKAKLNMLRIKKSFLFTSQNKKIHNNNNNNTNNTNGNNNNNTDY